ncbi:MAG TPA: outer membrane beta-barrel protein [Cyclobacteriaceae bacterium]|nr:outer membrane beta-barrel protein [Cyclobacteriaceae bacterium]
MKKLLFIVLVLLSAQAIAQVVNTATMDTTSFAIKGKVTVEGYVDAYYAYNFNHPGKDQPYFVSMARNNEININLAYIDLKYSSSRIRARFVPGFGTYINANYAAEQGSLKNIVEGSVGVKLSKTRNIWLDAGVFGSPYTNESAISKDHLAYTRSFAPEYVPYYLTGVKLGLPITGKLNAYLYLLNGWQQIEDKNDKLSAGTQLEYRPNDCLLINWDTYVGDERPMSDTTVSKRLFTDLYFIYTKGDFSATSCFYVGKQNGVWWNANFIARYNLTQKFSVTGRIEHFNDPKSVQIIPVTLVNGFRTSSSSVGINYKLADNMLLRFEGRTFFSDKEVFIRDGLPVRNSNTITSNVTIWF